LELVLGRLRERPLPEAPARFAVATLARLRREGRVVPPGIGKAFGELLYRLGAAIYGSLPLRLAPVACALVFLAVGWHFKQRHESQQLTYAALEMVAQGEESPFQDEEPSIWLDGSF
jgi:hypothetical protein